MFNDVIPRQVTGNIKENRFIEVDDWNNGKYFNGSDTEKLFNHNLSMQPPSWYYRTHPVKYTTNSNGYRTNEFDEIDWENSVVLIGCSTTFGIGIDDKDTISSQLSRLISLPVINMGIGGSSIQAALHNSTILRNSYPTPKAVVNIWTEYNRTLYYHQQKVQHLGPWGDNDDQGSRYLKEWTADDSHGRSHALLASKISKLLWESTKYYECSFFPTSAKILGCRQLYYKDRARDVMHPGIITNARAANIIANGIN